MYFSITGAWVWFSEEFFPLITLIYESIISFSIGIIKLIFLNFSMHILKQRTLTLTRYFAALNTFLCQTFWSW